MTHTKCGYPRCGFLSKSEDKCLLTGRNVSKDKDFCSNYTEHPAMCQLCKKITLAPILEEIDDETRVLCHSCSDAIGTCAGCGYNKDDCDFKTDPSPLPMFKMVAQRQGNAIVQMQILNPDRQAVTCIGCKCWDKEEKGCNKEFGCCANYTLSKEIFKNE